MKKKDSVLLSIKFQLPEATQATWAELVTIISTLLHVFSLLSFLFTDRPVNSQGLSLIIIKVNLSSGGWKRSVCLPSGKIDRSWSDSPRNNMKEPPPTMTTWTGCWNRVTPGDGAMKGELKHNRIQGLIQLPLDGHRENLVQIVYL